MKILGIGVDLVQNSRITNLLAKAHSRRFLVKTLHGDQLKQFDTISRDFARVQYVASRWAVKQAVVKAVGRRELIFSQLSIVKNQYGKPFLNVCSQQNKKIMQQLNVDTVHISLAHEQQYTTAYALALLK